MRGWLIRDLKLKRPTTLGGVILGAVVIVGVGLGLSRLLLEVPNPPLQGDALARINPPMGSEKTFGERAAKEPVLPKLGSERLSAAKTKPVQSKPAGVENPVGVKPSVGASVGASVGVVSSGAIAPGSGMLRVGNLTEHPLRVALLLRRLGPEKTPSPTSPTPSKSTYEPPAHWDFEPGEGAQKGLLLSLPNRKLKLKKGDILVAFAQDGSRRYWGPYVVGETSVPTWSSQFAEWELIVEP